MNPRSLRIVCAASLVACLAALAVSPAMAADRGYELVSPPNGTDDLIHSGFSTASGDDVFFASQGTMGIADFTGKVSTGFHARRSASGWAVDWATGPAGQVSDVVFDGGQVIASSPDGRRIVFSNTDRLFPGDTGDEADSFERFDGVVRWLSGPATPEPTAGSRAPLSVSADATRVVFASARPLLPADTDAVIDLYLSGPQGLSLMTPNTSIAVTGPTTRNAISSDGSRVFFTTASPNPALGDNDSTGDVYVNDAGTVKLVSAPTRTPPGTAAAVTFGGASTDGSQVLLTTNEQLTNDDTDNAQDLYRYSLTDGTLTRVSTGTNDNVAGQTATPVGNSDDGTAVFFLTPGILSPADTDGSSSLYVNRGGTTTYVSRLASGDTTVLGSANQPTRPFRTTTDGSAAVFTTTAAAAAGDTDARKDVYLWRAGSGLTRVSAGPTGGNSTTIDASITPPGRIVSDGATKVFFTTAEALVAADANGAADVYEWDNGAVSLISPGTAADDATYLDSSADGSTVFFFTAQTILPYDADTGVADVYASRIGGGFPAPSGSTLGATPPASGPGAVPSGPPLASTQPSPPEPAPPASSQRQASPPDQPATIALSSRTIRVTEDGGTLALTVPAPGRLEATLKSGDVMVAKGSATATRRGALRVPLRLTAQGRKRLRREGRIKVSVRLDLVTTDGQRMRQTTTVTITETTTRTKAHR